MELKIYDREVLHKDNNDLEARVARLIKEKNLYDRVTVISFSPLSVWKIKRLDSRIRTGLDMHRSKRPQESRFRMRAFVFYARHILKVDSLHPPYEDVSPRLVTLAHHHRLQLKPYVLHETRAKDSWFLA